MRKMIVSPAAQIRDRLNYRVLHLVDDAGTLAPVAKAYPRAVPELEVPTTIHTDVWARNYDR